MHQLYPAVESTQDILEVRKTQQVHLSPANLIMMGWLRVRCVVCGVCCL